MSVEANKETIRKMYQASADGDLDTYLGHLSDDIAYTVMGTHKFGRTYRGKQDMIDNLFAPLAGIFATPVVMKIGRMIGEGDLVAFEAESTAQLSSGAPYANSYCIVARFHDGKVVELREHLDSVQTARISGEA